MQLKLLRKSVKTELMYKSFIEFNSFETCFFALSFETETAPWNLEIPFRFTEYSL